MDKFNVYKDIQARTNGEIYLGVVGPVRTGKSTFIKRFMDICVLPSMENVHSKQRAIDELPQSATGKTIMTTEPKFVPNEAANIKLFDDVDFKIRLIDCVGFMVDGATGHIENEKERMVKTPWFENEIPFTQAAEIGTKKVINEHSTIGIVITTDGSFGEIPRENYVQAEERTVSELSKLSKPYVIILNSSRPFSDDTKELANQLSEKYKVAVLPVNCDQLKKDDVYKILESVLYEFPISELDFYTPKWMEMLSSDHWLKNSIINIVRQMLDNYSYVKDIKKSPYENDSEYVSDIKISNINMADGKVKIDVRMKDDIYFDILSELTGMEITNEYQLISTVKALSAKKKEFDKVANAISQVKLSGYGVVTPTKEEIQLEEPVVIKNGNKFGVKIKAQAPSINMLRTNINVEIAPIVGTKQQADDLIEYIKQSTLNNSDGIWDTNIFGKTIEKIVEDGINEKTHNITEESMNKISETLEKVMNENSGLVCLIV
ncbi:stage IV sporulation protein A [[Clostridium] fimetarium]|uniref:Stage IV sporulation protein A n=1 Tax=[Clostridium] fimetarium TaxID=99656 RepID=A0A1I0QKE9_9FIRM|nr:stage IV sporulation protein A [[Clostridium] fimetarium]SEW27691.1 stage IV sporulation protein A [[Clostridium] fimetarium]